MCCSGGVYDMAEVDELQLVDEHHSCRMAARMGRSATKGRKDGPGYDDTQLLLSFTHQRGITLVINHCNAFSASEGFAAGAVENSVVDWMHYAETPFNPNCMYVQPLGKVETLVVTGQRLVMDSTLSMQITEQPTPTP